MNEMKSLTLNGTKYDSFPDQSAEKTENKVTVIDENSTDEQYPSAKAVYDLVTEPEVSDKYFDIDVDGIVSLKPEYRGVGKSSYPFSISDNGLENEGTLLSELPEVIIVPDVIGDTAVSGFTEGTFAYNYRIKSLTIPQIADLPKGFCDGANFLTEIKGTEQVKVIGQGAFQKCGIKFLSLPNLLEATGAGHFNQCANMLVVNIGEKVTTIPASFFSQCENLSSIRGGAGVTSIGAKAFWVCKNLKNLPLLSNEIQSIGANAFAFARTQYDWSALTDCTFGDYATPAQLNPTDWWSSATYTAFEMPPLSTFEQDNPEWADQKIGNSDIVYRDGCMLFSAIHAHSALAEVELASPFEFVNAVGAVDESILSLAVSAYDHSGICPWLEALGYECTTLQYSSDNLQTLYDALASGAVAITNVVTADGAATHAIMTYGISENGELLAVDSDSKKSNLQTYTADTFKMPVQNMVKTGDYFTIVRKTA